MHFAHDSHVFTQFTVLLFEKSILFLEFDVPVKEFASLFVIPGLADTYWTFWHDTFDDAGFFSESESVGPDYFTRPLGRSLAEVTTGV